MILKLCRRCKKSIVYPASYCDSCHAIVKEEREQAKATANKKANRKYNSKRDPKYIKFYLSTDWKILSAKYMSDHDYKCEDCGSIATEVHHIKPIQTEEGWELRLSYDNLRNQCVECHNKKHNRFQRRRS
ncbi:HNH endonuclease [Bacillus sp. JJ722]|uniref:HNH endonuclease n=1 Tax=Bacillus sp. JJ722 TaxID=3122973 RepID=UPI002FFD94D3